MSLSDHGRSSMSRRKPVPKFIPSPPPSPPSSPGAPFRQISLLSGSPTQTDMPPLPEDWRDVIDRMVSKDKRLALPNTAVDQEVLTSENGCEGEQQSPASTEFGTTRSFTFAPPSPSGSYDGEPVSRPDSPTPWTRPGGKRRVPTEYRPPTPPLPRQRSRSAESGSESPTVVVKHPARSLPHPPERRLNVSSPLPAPKLIRHFPDVRKVPLPTPPPSWSTHEPAVIAYSSGHTSPPLEKTSAACSVGTFTHTPSPSTLYSEKNIPHSIRAVSVKSQQPAQNPSVEQVRTKIELLPMSKSLPARPGVFRQALTRGLNGLRRVRALVASAFLCR
ncbi:hypothetical protein J3A83DRAFT_4370256 [Scleroderma citrinum]